LLALLVGLAVGEEVVVGADGSVSPGAVGAAAEGAGAAAEGAGVAELVSPPSTRSLLEAFYASVGEPKDAAMLNEILASYTLDELVTGLRAKYGRSIGAYSHCAATEPGSTLQGPAPDGGVPPQLAQFRAHRAGDCCEACNRHPACGGFTFAGSSGAHACRLFAGEGSGAAAGGLSVQSGGGAEGSVSGLRSIALDASVTLEAWKAAWREKLGPMAPQDVMALLRAREAPCNGCREKDEFIAAAVAHAWHPSLEALQAAETRRQEEAKRDAEAERQRQEQEQQEGGGNAGNAGGGGGGGGGGTDKNGNLDPYEVLGCATSATAKEIKKLYRSLSIKYHPDKNIGDAAASQKFAEITAAYAILGDPDKRAEHDNFGDGKTKGFQTKGQWERQRTGGGTDDFYSGSRVVTQLDTENFRELVDDSDAAWLLEFYAPWCTHCVLLREEFRSAASQLDGVANVGAVNCERGENSEKICARFGVRSFPTIKLFIPAEQHEEVYSADDRTADGFVKFVRNGLGVKSHILKLSEPVPTSSTTAEEDAAAAKEKKERMEAEEEGEEEEGGEEAEEAEEGEGEAGRKAGGGKTPEEPPPPAPEEADESWRTETTPERFERLVAKSPKLWILYFSSSAETDCRFCTAAHGLLRHLSSSLRQVAGVGSIDCARDAEFCRAHSAEQFPHVRLYRSGAGSKGVGESVWARAFSSTSEVHLALQVVERVVRTSLGSVMGSKGQLQRKKEADGKGGEEDEEDDMPEPEKEEEPQQQFPDAPPQRQEGGYVPENYEAPPDMIGY
jgi:DnaJ-domain-containing protein 1/thiol-disulfide isomerase/thioredoxin